MAKRTFREPFRGFAKEQENGRLLRVVRVIARGTRKAQTTPQLTLCETSQKSV